VSKDTALSGAVGLGTASSQVRWVRRQHDREADSEGWPPMAIGGATGYGASYL